MSRELVERLRDVAIKNEWEMGPAAKLLHEAADALEAALADADRWREVERRMVHQRSGPNVGWTLDVLLPGDSPADAIDAARGQHEG